MGHFCVDISVVFSYQTAISYFVRVEAWKLMKIFFSFPFEDCDKNLFNIAFIAKRVLEKALRKVSFGLNLCEWIQFAELNGQSILDIIEACTWGENPIMMMSKLLWNQLSLVIFLAFWKF